MTYRRFLSSTAAAVVLAVGALAAPSAMAAGANPNVAISSISCSQPGDCSAVSNYNDTIGFGHGLLLTETNGSWGAGVQAQLPANAAPDAIPAVTTELAHLSALYHAISLSAGVQSVSCSSPGNCVAVGSYTTKSRILAGLILNEKNGKWARGVQAPAPKAEVGLDQLSCTGAGDCVALGIEVAPKALSIVPVEFTEKAGQWSQGVVLKLPASVSHTGFFNFPSALSCPSAGNCVGVGGSLSLDFTLKPLIFTESDGSWKTASVKLPANSRAQQGEATLLGGAAMTAVSCSGAGACTAAGEYQDQRLQEQPFVTDLNGSSWSKGTELTLPAGAATAAGYQGAEVDGIDCPLTGDCSAVGSYTDNNHNQQGLLLTEAHGTWSPGQEATLPAPFKQTVNGQFVVLTGISCVSAGDCVATGSYNYGSELRPRTSLVLQQSGGSWSDGTNLTLPSDAAHIQANIAASVTCLPQAIQLATPGLMPGNGCTVAGTYTNLLGQSMGIAASSSGGSFGQGTAMTIPGLNRTELVDSLYSVLQPPFEPQSGITQIRKAGGFTYKFTSPEKGQVTSDWYAKLDGHEQLIGSLKASVFSAGTFKERLKLTAAGHKALQTSKTVDVTAKASFTSAGGTRVQNSGKFPLNRIEDNGLGGIIFAGTSGTDTSGIRDQRLANYLAHHAF